MITRACLVAAGLFLLSAESPAVAASSLTYVSGFGRDAGACTRAAPCRLFRYAITQTTPGGVIAAIDRAGYGVVRITQSVTILGPGQGAGTSPNAPANGNSSIDIEAPGATVILRGIDIIGGFDGIVVGQAARVVISDSTISGTSNLAINVVDTGAAVLVQDVTVHDAEVRSSGSFIAKRVTVSNSPSNDISVLTGHAVIDECTLSGGGNVGISVFAMTAFIKHDYVTFTGLRGISVSGGSIGYINSTTTFGSGQIGISNSESTVYSYGNDNFPDGTNGAVTPIAGD